MRWLLALALSSSFFAAPALAETQSAIFAGGCFWSVEKDFDPVPGVVATTSGYIGGENENPTYRNHGSHREAVKVDYDPAKTSYAKLLDVFWHSIDPTDPSGQFCDQGHSYTTAVYAVGDADLKAAHTSKLDAQKELGQDVVTEVLPAPQFWPAEEYHQDFYKKNPDHYDRYRAGCRRDARVAQVWGESAHRGIPTH
ncbi:MAG: peptide-methionine (S)-S-oxide reductase [Mesorhizobium amorphae]|nr:MAG: peptide-methionine (S)-S-oxide reductase [Mesorhizobium amorphae]